MYGDTSPSKTVPGGQSGVLTRMDGLASVRFSHRDGAARLVALDQRTPLRVLFPKPAPGGAPVAAITTVSGGLVGGDTLSIAVSVEEQASAVAIGQAAEKVYRSTGPDSIVEVALDVGDAGWLEWLPQETILFDGACLRRRTIARVSPGGRLLAGECIVFGRLASGEIMRSGRVFDRWEIRIDDRLVWADALRLEDDILPILDAVAGFDGARAYATAVYVGPDATTYLDLARDLAANAEGTRAGATCREDVLIVRWLAAEPLALRRAFETFWMEMRKASGGWTERLSRLWYV